MLINCPEIMINCPEIMIYTLPKTLLSRNSDKVSHNVYKVSRNPDKNPTAFHRLIGSFQSLSFQKIGSTTLTRPPLSKGGSSAVKRVELTKIDCFHQSHNGWMDVKECNSNFLPACKIVSPSHESDDCLPWKKRCSSGTE